MKRSSPRVPIAFLSMFVLAGADAAAQGVVWTQRFPQTSPPARTRHAMAYDEAREQIVLFGGVDAGIDVLGDTWVWDGNNWEQRFPSTSPWARHGHAMAYYAAGGYVLLFGGSAILGGPGDIGSNETWKWDGTNWQQLFPADVPSARKGHAMAYDSLRGRVVMHAGQPIGDTSTHEWNGTTWLATPAAVLNAGPEWAMAFDPALGVTILMGEDTWKWDGNEWILAYTLYLPWQGQSLAYAANRGRIVGYGGKRKPDRFNPGFVEVSDTIEWAGTGWATPSPMTNPGLRHQHAAAFDAARGRMILFGGEHLGTRFDDTWEYHGTAPASFSSFGTGCPGSVGTPLLDAAPGHLPWISDTFRVQLSGLPNGVANIPFGVLGLSKETWGGISLPHDLGLLGFWGCDLYVSLDFAAPLVNEGGTATWEIPLPSNPNLIGFPFYLQGAVLDFGINPGNAVVSNAAEAVLGAR